MEDKYKVIIKKRDLPKENLYLSIEKILGKHPSDFDINFTHESTAMAGNTLTLRETKFLLEMRSKLGEKKFNAYLNSIK